jgi:glutamine cyclotransferase
VESLDFRITGQLRHSREDFTQGLEIHEGRLLQGTGRYGASRLQAFDLQSGELLREYRLPGHYFGEGITVVGNRLVQLTWRSGKAIVYDPSTFEPLEEFTIPGQGWGLTNDGRRLIYSDGSDTLRFIEPGTWKVTGELRVHRKGNPLMYLNELEWSPGGILANVYRRDVIVRIDPESGEVTGEINLAGLLPRSEFRADTDVLNGIARDPADGSLWVTGKNWPWIYRLELLEQDEGPGNSPGNREVPDKNQ